ncbi:fimbrial protein [Herbaspirillum rhizosphaerae]|uniref:fimbrial protein n=1 Tax=Herbaspirillum rhizosphaerae TaxID=346179 RepID=UPI00067D6E8D|nr:hypothetical protein [Herbaspirillum rhizosphaerae]
MSTANSFFQRSFVFSILVGASSLAFAAAGGVIRFSGAITEPACTIQNQTIDLQTLNKTTGNQIPLNVHCHANQSVQISIQDVDTSRSVKTFSGGMAGTEIAIRHNAVLVAPGDKINYYFAGQKDVVVPFTATMSSGADAGVVRHGSILVSFDYR